MNKNNYLIEHMFAQLIAEYGEMLPDDDKPRAREIFIEILDLGFNKEQLYWLIWNLGSRELIRNYKLLFYKPYQDEAYNISITSRKMNKDYNYSLWEVSREFSLIGEFGNIYDENTSSDFLQVAAYESRLFNNDTFTDDELNKIYSLFFKHCLKPRLSIKKQDMNNTRNGVISQMRECKIFADFSSIPFHDYQY